MYPGSLVMDFSKLCITNDADADADGDADDINPFSADD